MSYKQNWITIRPRTRIHLQQRDRGKQDWKCICRRSLKKVFGDLALKIGNTIVRFSWRQKKRTSITVCPRILMSRGLRPFTGTSSIRKANGELLLLLVIRKGRLCSSVSWSVILSLTYIVSCSASKPLSNLQKVLCDHFWSTYYALYPKIYENKESRSRWDNAEESALLCNRFSTTGLGAWLEKKAELSRPDI